MLDGKREVEVLEVPIARLDTALAGESLVADVLLKLDLQGNELEALRGAEHTLRQCRQIILETVFEAEYADEPLFEEIWDASQGSRIHLRTAAQFLPRKERSHRADGRRCSPVAHRSDPGLTAHRPLPTSDSSLCESSFTTTAAIRFKCSSAARWPRAGTRCCTCTTGRSRRRAERSTKRPDDRDGIQRRARSTWAKWSPRQASAAGCSWRRSTAIC